VVSGMRCRRRHIDCSKAISHHSPHGHRGAALPRPASSIRHLAFMFLGLAAMVGAANTPTPWTDVCTAEDYQNYRAELCQDVFVVSTLAFDPLYPKSPANVTIIVQPSKTLYSSFAIVQYIEIYLPEFEPYAPVNLLNAMLRDLTVTANNPPVVGQDPATGYNTRENPLFESPAQWDTQTRRLRLTITPGTTTALLEGVDTEVRVCCLRLPVSSAKDNFEYKIHAPTSQSNAIEPTAVMRTPYIDPGYQFDYLQILFDPPLSQHLTVISLIMRSATPLGNQNRIILHLPEISREPPESGVIEFNTAASADPKDWMLFSYQALWDNDRHTITFFMRQGAVLDAGKQVTLRTNPGEFRLPKMVVSNWDKLQVEVRSADDIDMVIRPTAVTQASRVPTVREFTYSELKYENNQPYQKSIVSFKFSTNRPMYAGMSIFIRLSGFQAEVVDVVLIGTSGKHFHNARARFDLPANLIELKVNKTFYSNEKNFTVTFEDLFLPPAAYPNDPSLVIKTSDAVANWQPIQHSPAIGTGTKEFIQSQILLYPMDPRMAANITFIIRPSIIFYQGDKIIFHLYGFLYTEGTQVTLSGPKAHYIKNSEATWDPEPATLTFEVADNELILNTEAFEVVIDKRENFRLPDKLSKNDGICRIEGQGNIINMEPMKKTPKIGEDKFVIQSRIEFQPIDDTGVLSDSIARIWFKLILNTDVLPNSTIYIKLGGLLRKVPNNPLLQSGPIRLSGSNAPLFTHGEGRWNGDTNILSVRIVHNVQIKSGVRIRFFIERDQYFKLPYAMYPSDPSFRIMIPEAGISERQFNFSTRVNQEIKAFTESTMFYGATQSSVMYPGDPADITLKFMVNVRLPSGSILRIHLPGFATPLTEVPIGSPAVQVVGESYMADTVRLGTWNQMMYTLDLLIPISRYITRNVLWVMRLVETMAQFRLPKGSLAPNDQRLMLEVVSNQIIYAEPIKSSPRVISRSFAISRLEYIPPTRESIFQLVILLQPTVNITDQYDIVITLPRFRRIDSLANKNVHLIGPGRAMIKDSMAAWNQSTFELKFRAPEGQVLPAFGMLELRVQEAQGFILPPALKANDTQIKIAAIGAAGAEIIKQEDVKESPMVGNGPYRSHLFCMQQYERGVRTIDGICDVHSRCLDPNPPLEDPCSPEEMIRCDCPPLTEEPVNITVKGFQLQPEDRLAFIPYELRCDDPAAVGQGMLSSFSPPQQVYISPNNSWLAFENISSVDSGYYRICMNHVGSMYDVGKIVVRPSCPGNLVLVDGVCVNDCPKTKIPIAGDCLRDPLALQPEERQALMLPITIDDETQKRSIANAPTDDPERKYFMYRFIYDLASLLNCDSKRILISSLSNSSVTSVIINTIFTPAVDVDSAVTVTDERSPLGLVSLFKKLQVDTSSSMYDAGSLFKDIVRAYKPEPIKVRKCPEDGEYRVFCPFVMGQIWSFGTTFLWYSLGQLVVALCFVLLCCGVWRVDGDRSEPLDEDLLEKLVRDPKLVEPEVRLEFARSWIEGRFMGEKWQKEREKQFFALGN